MYISNVFTYRVCYHVWPWLSEFSGVVLNCFTLSNSTIFTDGSRINPEESSTHCSIQSVFTGMGQETCEWDGPFLIIFIRWGHQGKRNRQRGWIVYISIMSFWLRYVTAGHEIERDVGLGNSTTFRSPDPPWSSLLGMNGPVSVQTPTCSSAPYTR